MNSQHDNIHVVIVHFPLHRAMSGVRLSGRASHLIDTRPYMSCFGQPKLTHTMPAPDALICATMASSSSAVNLRNGGEIAPAILNLGKQPRAWPGY